MLFPVVTSHILVFSSPSHESVANVLPSGENTPPLKLLLLAVKEDIFEPVFGFQKNTVPLPPVVANIFPSGEKVLLVILRFGTDNSFSRFPVAKSQMLIFPGHAEPFHEQPPPETNNFPSGEKLNAG